MQPHRACSRCARQVSRITHCVTATCHRRRPTPARAPITRERRRASRLAPLSWVPRRRRLAPPAPAAAAAAGRPRPPSSALVALAGAPRRGDLVPQSAVGISSSWTYRAEVLCYCAAAGLLARAPPPLRAALPGRTPTAPATPPAPQVVCLWPAAAAAAVRGVQHSFASAGLAAPAATPTSYRYGLRPSPDTRDTRRRRRAAAAAFAARRCGGGRTRGRGAVRRAATRRVPGLRAAARRRQCLFGATAV